MIKEFKTACRIVGDKLQSHGGEVRSFSSGGGIRVFRYEVDGELVAYGESCNADLALVELGKQIAISEYSSVGEYWTGQSQSSSELDATLSRSGKIQFRFVDKQFRATIESYEEQKLPKILHEYAAELGQPIYFATERNFLFQFRANLDGSATWHTVKHPENQPAHRAHLWKVKQVATGKTLMEAFENARQAPKIEIFE